VKPSFLQTVSWQKFQESVGHPTWRLESSALQATVVKHDVALKKNYLYIPHGPVIMVEKMRGVRNEMTQFVEAITKLGRAQNAMFVKIEPQNDVVVEFLYDAGAKLRRSSKALQPTQSVVIDLSQSEEQLLSKMHHKTRYNINLGERKGLTFEEGGDSNIFWNLLQKTTEHDKFASHSKQYYQKLLALDGELQVKLFFVKFQQKPIAGVIVLTHGDQAYYLHGAMDRDYRNLMAPYFMHWQVMRSLQNQGCTAYDLWGIDAKKWPGVTRFKLGWGGKQIEYPGAFDLVLKPIWYDIYRIVRKLRP
jgi:peptidoglycan pentaglycine glycine transferase (the first glycine)